MKNIFVSAFIISCLTFPHLSFAVEKGPYVGLGLGVSKLNEDDSHNYETSGKIYAGYNINEQFGLELNFVKYNEIKINENTAGKVKLNSVTLLAKTYFKLNDLKAHPYISAGLAEANYQNKLNPHHGYEVNELRPILGVGLNYDLNKNFTTGIEVTHLIKSNNIPSANQATVNFTYNFSSI